jgi:hypothetical protein
MPKLPLLTITLLALASLPKADLVVSPLTALFPEFLKRSFFAPPYSSQIGYVVPPNFTSTNKLLSFFGPAYSTSFNYTMLVETRPSESLHEMTKAFSTTALGLVELTVQLRNQTWILKPSSFCSITSGNSFSQLLLLDCNNPNGESTKLVIQSNVTIGSTRGVSTRPGETPTITANSIFTFAFSVQVTHFATPVSNRNAVASVEKLLVQLSTTNSTQLVTFSKESADSVGCSFACLSCDSSGRCTACQVGFSLSGGSCRCSGSLVTSHTKDSNSRRDLTTEAFFHEVFTCLATGQSDQTVSKLAECQRELNHLFWSKALTVIAPSSLSNSDINLLIAKKAGANSTAFDSDCLQKSTYVILIQVNPSTESWRLFYSLSPEGQTLFNTQFPIAFPSPSVCREEVLQGFFLRAVTCELATAFMTQQNGLNSTLTALPNRFVSITSLNSTVKLPTMFFIPVYPLDDSLGVKTTGALSAVICLDQECQRTLKQPFIVANDTLYVQITFLDPLVNYFRPEVFANLTLNGVDHSQGITDRFDNRNQSYVQLVYQLYVLNANVTGTVLFGLSFASRINSPGSYAFNASSQFRLTVNPMIVVVIPFAETLKFHMLVFNIALVLVVFVGGFVLFFVDKGRGKPVRVALDVRRELAMEPSPYLMSAKNLSDNRVAKNRFNPNRNEADFRGEDSLRPGSYVRSSQVYGRDNRITRNYIFTSVRQSPLVYNRDWPSSEGIPMSEGVINNFRK